MVELTSEEKVMFNYLNDLRDSGVTNMFGAGPYLVDSFGLTKRESHQVVKKWMDNFIEEGY
jgi:hypothetical protein